ncbi:cyclic nucleotide-binding domain-containing protein [Neolewinella persica]|uniref:hypothetical protein n=1 Tax=Neolewinella persica TaxID=70998 RepID=UPI000369B473|nr:hypothetical protein [Neolewinella persica]
MQSKIYAVKSGLLRSYSINEKGKEHIFIFASVGWGIADSAPPNLPSELFIDALGDSEAVMLYKEEDNKVNYIN